MPQGLRERKKYLVLLFKKKKEEEMKLNRGIEQHKIKSIAQNKIIFGFKGSS